MATERTCDGCGEVRSCLPWEGKHYCAACFPVAAMKTVEVLREQVAQLSTSEAQAWALVRNS
jgi:hypothetical protein